MDLQDDFSFMFSDDGDDLTIDGVDLKGFVGRPGPVLEPYHGADGEASGTFIVVQRGDLEDLGQWPLNDPVVEIATITYRVIRPHESAGHVVLYLEEA